MRIKQKSITLLLLCAMIPLVAISIISFRSAQEAFQTQAATDLQADTIAAIGRIEAFFEKVTLDIASWSTAPVLQDVLIDDDDGEITQELVRLSAQYGYFAGFLVLNDQGVCIAATDKRNLGRDFTGTESVQVTLEGGSYRGRVGASDFTDLEGLVFAVPIHADYDAGTIIGALVGVVDWARIESILSGVLVWGHEQDSQHVLVLRRADDSRIIYQSGDTGARLLGPGQGGFLTRAANSSGSGSFSDPGWVMYAAVGTKVVYAGIDALRRNSLIVGAVVFIVVLGIGLWGATHLSKPIISITQVMEALAGGQIDVPITAIDRTDEIGEMARSLLVFKDTAIKRMKAEGELRQAMEAAEQSSLAKSRFLAAASHDLRQPLHAQGLFVASLFEQTQRKESRDILEKMEQSVEALDTMLGALLDITSLETGALKPEPVDFRIYTLLRSLEVDFAPTAEEKGIELRVVPCNAIVHSDLALLSRIVRNLLSNAIRYTVTGRVLLGCRRRPNALCVEVWDTGIGIPEPMFDRMFEEFYRARDIDSSGKKRLGLGLAIVQRMAGLLGHRIEFTSAEGRGSMFAVEVPYGRTSSTLASTYTESLSSDIAGTVVLVIDDDVQVLSAMRGMLENWDCEVVASQSATDALASLEELGRIPDLAVVDYRLADGQTGFEAMDRIEAAYGSRIRTVMITGTTTVSLVSEAWKNGYQILHKPVQPAKLRAIINYVLETPKDSQAENRRRAGNAPRRQHDEPDPAPKHIV